LACHRQGLWPPVGGFKHDTEAKLRCQHPASRDSFIFNRRDQPKWVVAALSTELMRIRTKMVKLAGELAPVGQENLHALFD
jgi:hypothetical protein